MALHNSGRSVPLLLLAIAFIVWLGVQAQQPWAAAGVALTGVCVAAWRLLISRRYADTSRLDEAGLRRVQRALEGNAALAGLMWIIGTLGIYPQLPGITATFYVLMTCGSLAVAAFFMSLVGRSFLILTVSQVGSAAAASLFIPSVESVPLAILEVVFGVTLLKASSEFAVSNERAIGHRLEVERASESLKRAKEAAESANLAKSQFLAMMSHEIRTPMNGVLGALELLRQSQLDAQQRRLVRTAAASGESLMAILNDVLDHSKIEAGMLNLVSAPMSLHSVARSVVTLFRANAESKGLSLAVELDDDTPNWVLGDAQRLKQVLLNLVGNAIKFTEQGGVTVRLRGLPAHAGTVRVLFEVQDTGIGIPAGAREHLFQPFHQIDGNRNRRRGGTGLGLAISQRIVEAMGGHIEVDSAPGAGSRFRFALTLPADPSPAPPTQPDSAMMGLDEPAAPLAGTVLLVEDNVVNRMIGVEMLESLGMRVVEAEDGAQALTQLDRYEIDLVLMDCQMPVMDGYTATEQIRVRESRFGLPRVPIVALTANAFDEDVARVRAVGMDGHLAKPYTRNQLRELLSRWI